MNHGRCNMITAGTAFGDGTVDTGRGRRERGRSGVGDNGQHLGRGLSSRDASRLFRTRW